MSPLWPWWWGGLAVAVVAVGYPWLAKTTLGVSGMYVAWIDRLSARARAWRGQRDDRATAETLAAELARITAEEFGHPVDGDVAASASRFAETSQNKRARPWFLIGMVLGAALITGLDGAWPASAMSLGHRFDLRFGGDPIVAAGALFGAGLAIGAGTRMSGGCTSGHGISGVACGQRGSLLSTATFWSVGVGVTWLLTGALGR